MAETRKIDASEEKWASAWLNKIRKLIKQEGRLLLSIKKDQLKADLLAFEIGHEILAKHWDLKQEGKDKGFLDGLAGEFGVEPQTIRNYTYLARGAVFAKCIKQYRLPRKYFQALGRSIAATPDFLTAMILPGLMEHPLVDDEGDADPQRLVKVGVLVKATRKIIAEHFNVNLDDVEAGVGSHHDRIWIRFPEEVPKKTGDRVCSEIKNLFENIAAYSKEPWRAIIEVGDSIKGTIGDEKGRLTQDKLVSKVGGIIYQRGRDLKIDAILEKQTPQAKKTISQKLFHGKAQDVLRDESKFPPRSVDCVITDPPYSRELYTEVWRPWQAVEHDAEDTIEEQAKVVADVARTILRQKINKEQFAWYSFMPISYVHRFLPPLLQVFEEEVPEPKKGAAKKFRHQILVWDKKGSKIQGDEMFVPTLEAIAYISIHRPIALRRPDERAPQSFRSPLFRRKPNKGRRKAWWKPPELLRDLIYHSTYGDRGSAAAKRQVVLDPFCGSGTTGIAAMTMEHPRDFRLIESHPKQFRIATAELTDCLQKNPKKPKKVKRKRR